MLLNKFEKHKILRSDSRSLVGGRWGCPPPCHHSQNCRIFVPAKKRLFAPETRQK